MRALTGAARASTLADMTEAANETDRGARALVRAADRATLATRLAEDGWPYASLAMVACGQDAAPLLLLSDLAEHSRNLAAEARASLLYDGTAGLDSPLTGARATLLGRIEKCDDAGLRARYLRRHPEAERYAGFADFSLYRMAVERAHLVAGFGEIHWLAAEAVVDGEATALAESEAGIVDHMNADHADAVALYAGRLLGLDGDDWVMTGIDPEGLDLRRGRTVARLAFDGRVTDAETARAVLVALARRAGTEGAASG